jgi:hypothetical protein
VNIESEKATDIASGKDGFNECDLGVCEGGGTYRPPIIRTEGLLESGFVSLMVRRVGKREICGSIESTHTGAIMSFGGHLNHQELPLR